MGCKSWISAMLLFLECFAAGFQRSENYLAPSTKLASRTCLMKEDSVGQVSSDRPLVEDFLVKGQIYI